MAKPFGPSVETQSLNPESVQGTTDQFAAFLNNLLQDPTGNAPFGGLANFGQQALGSVFGQGGQGGSLSPLLQGAGLGAANQVIGAAQPIFNQQNQQGLAQLGAQAPSATGSAFGLQGIDFLTQRNAAFDQFAASALQQGQQTALQAGGLFNQLAGNAGQQQQAQVVNPTLQLLLGGMGFAQPRSEAVIQPGALDYLTQLAPLAPLLPGGISALGGLLGIGGGTSRQNTKGG